MEIPRVVLPYHTNDLVDAANSINRNSEADNNVATSIGGENCCVDTNETTTTIQEGTITISCK
jgi:hypothetical protein